MKRPIGQRFSRQISALSLSFRFGQSERLLSAVVVMSAFDPLRTIARGIAGLFARSAVPDPLYGYLAWSLVKTLVQSLTD